MRRSTICDGAPESEVGGGGRSSSCVGATVDVEGAEASICRGCHLIATLPARKSLTHNTGRRSQALFRHRHTHDFTQAEDQRRADAPEQGISV